MRTALFLVYNKSLETSFWSFDVNPVSSSTSKQGLECTLSNGLILESDRLNLQTKS